MEDVKSPEKITLREFRMWMDGLLAGNEERNSLPSLDQWRKILAMLERVEAEATVSHPHYVPVPCYPSTSPNYISPYPYLTGGTNGLGNLNHGYAYGNN